VLWRDGPDVQDGFLWLLFFEGDCDRCVCRKANLLSFDIGDQAQGDEVMMAFVPTFATVRLGELDLAVLNAINGPDMNAVGSDHFHVLFDLAAVH
jgi:hypothetical protein